MYVSLRTTILCYTCIIGQGLILFSYWLFILLAALFPLPCKYYHDTERIYNESSYIHYDLAL